MNLTDAEKAAIIGFPAASMAATNAWLTELFQSYVRIRQIRRGRAFSFLVPVPDWMAADLRLNVYRRPQ